MNHYSFAGLVANLLNRVIAVASPRRRSSGRTVESYDRNRDKPCSVIGCSKPRHRTKSGKCRSGRCSVHHLASQKISRDRFKEAK